jgi:hypothetical protein
MQSNSVVLHHGLAQSKYQSDEEAIQRKEDYLNFCANQHKGFTKTLF